MTTAAIFIGRLTNDTNETISHDEVARFLGSLYLKYPNIDIYAMGAGQGMYEGQPEPCTFVLANGDQREIDEFTTAIANHATASWRQECIGYVATNNNTLRYADNEIRQLRKNNETVPELVSSPHH